MLGLTFLAHHTFERAASGTMIVFAAACLWSGCRFHRRWGLFGLLGAGAVLVLYLQFAGSSEEREHTDWIEAALMGIGGALIAISHVLNRRLRVHCHCLQCNAARKADSKSPQQS
jgi:hypothetical protein